MTLTFRIGLACLCTCMLTEAGAEDRSATVDALFSRWNSTATPGMNVAVFNDGKPLLVRSYGMANIELAQPNQSDTVFPIGSVSKQFTAYGIQLLAHDGKLALTDDVRKFIPELHDFDKPITLDMLLTHTSGLRDNVNLLMLQGHRIDDVISFEESFAAVLRQRELNFPSGTRHHYSNANYVLLAKVIERVSGLSFADFIDRHVLRPLAMSSTSVVTNPVRVTPNRASGYSGSSERKLYFPQPTVDSTYGSNGILSTIADLATWSANFHGDAKVTPKIFAAMTRPGVLLDGIPITYASGLHVETFHGLPYVEHTGAVAGFTSNLLVFPEQKLSIIVLANNDECDATELAFAVAGVYLNDDLRRPAPRPKAVSIAGSILDKYAGTYEILTGTSMKAPGRRITFTRDGNALRFADESAPLLAASRTQFFSATSDLRVSFRPMRDEKDLWLAVVHDPAGMDFIGRRVPEAPAAGTVPASTANYPGFYYSTELETTFVVVRSGDAFSVKTARGEVPLVQQGPALYIAQGDRARGQFRGTITFVHEAGEVDSLLVSSANRRASNVRFTKVGELEDRRQQVE